MNLSVDRKISQSCSLHLERRKVAANETSQEGVVLTLPSASFMCGETYGQSFVCTREAFEDRVDLVRPTGDVVV